MISYPDFENLARCNLQVIGHPEHRELIEKAAIGISNAIKSLYEQEGAIARVIYLHQVEHNGGGTVDLPEERDITPKGIIPHL